MVAVAVAGSVNLDLVATVPALPRPGETVTGARLARYPGGKGANQALAARRLGADVIFFAAVGEDTAADDALALLRAEGVDLTGLQVCSGTPTGMALIAVAPDGENQIVVAPGANAAFQRPHRLPAADALISQLELSVDAVAAIALAFEGFVCLNPAPARAVPDALLSRADLVVVNETEDAFYGPQLELCRGMVARTFGRAGAALYRDGREIARAAGLNVETVDATGAGDCFTAALTLALLEDMEPPTALDFACRAAAFSTTRNGAQTSFPTRREIAEMTNLGKSE